MDILKQELNNVVNKARVTLSDPDGDYYKEMKGSAKQKPSINQMKDNRARQATKEMLQQIHDRLQQYRLREGFKSAEDFDVSKVVSPSSINKWEGKTNESLFTAAKKGDKTALEYIFYKMKGAIVSTFWKNYLGPNGQIRKYRIQAENAWEQWLSIAWMAMNGGFNEANDNPVKGALDSFDVTKANEKNMFNIFAKRYKSILRNAAVNANHAQKTAGISGREVSGGSADVQVYQYEPTWAEKGDGGWNPDGDDTSSGGSGYEDGTFTEVDDRMHADDFMNKWKKFVQDERLQQGTKTITIAEVFYEAIDNPQAAFPAMAQKFGIARNSIATLMSKAQDIMSDYNIIGQELMAAIKFFGNDKVASYLKNSEPVQELPKNSDDNTAAEVKKNPSVKPVQKNDNNFLTNFENAFNDDEFWLPHIRGADAANVLLWWINEDYPTHEELADEYNIREVDIGYWYRKAFRLLKKLGIRDTDIKDAVKRYGKRKVMDCIGKPDPNYEFNEQTP